MPSVTAVTTNALTVGPERADPDQYQEAQRTVERQKPASVPGEHEKRPHEPRAGIRDDEIGDQRITTDQAAHAPGSLRECAAPTNGAVA
jgi:hypothetical protein